jgi:hypothetical protein
MPSNSTAATVIGKMIPLKRHLYQNCSRALHSNIVDEAVLLSSILTCVSMVLHFPDNALEVTLSYNPDALALPDKLFCLPVLQALLVPSQLADVLIADHQ